MDFIKSILLLFVLLAAFIWWFFLAPEKLRNFVHNVFLSTLIIAFEFVGICLNLTKVATAILYFFGKVGTLLVLCIALYFATNEVMLIYGISFANNSELYKKCLELLSQPYAWASLAAIVASTSAISQIIKHEFEFEQYLENQKSKWESGIKNN